MRAPSGGRRWPQSPQPSLPLARSVVHLPTGSRIKGPLQGCHFRRREWEEARSPEGERPFKPWKTYSSEKCFELRQGQEKAVLKKGFLPSSFGKGHVFLLKPQDLKETPKGALGGSPEVLTHSQGSTVSPKGLRTPRGPSS